MSEKPGLLMKYFVLKPHGTDAYAKASQDAMSAYADSIRSENPDLADELIRWVVRESELWQAFRKTVHGGVEVPDDLA